MAFDSTRASFRTISLGFMAVIMIGAILLYMPFASNQLGCANFLDCLFTATSATCVTGLIVHDTATHWTLFGQLVIIILIQLGGMGVLTVALAFTRLSGRVIDLDMRSTMQDSISAPRMGGIVRLASFIIKGTLIIEAVGAFLLFWVFYPIYGTVMGMWYAVFHSISAFCNAGFDLMGVRTGPFSSLTSFVDNPLINIVICSLIIVGGLGFLTWKDICHNTYHIQKYTMQSKAILTCTLFLILLPLLYFFTLENLGLPASPRFWSSLFQTVTVRTAGFNTMDFNQYSENGIFLLIVLMLIGGAPGSTAGGMKTTTFVVILATALSVYRRQESTQCFERRIPEETVRQALAILSLYLLLCLSSAVAISLVEGIPLLTCLFETTSAIATVGVTMGITPHLGWFAKSLLIFLMFFGRVGGLTIIYATVKYNPRINARYPKGKMTVG